MRISPSFFKPSTTRLVFLVEWALFLAFTGLRGELSGARQWLVAAYPLLFFYLLGCALTAFNRPTRRPARRWALLVSSAVLAGIDQLAKLAVLARLPQGASLPILPGWLHLAHERNLYGSWLVSVLPLGSAGMALMLGAVAICLLLAAYYLTHGERRSAWLDTAFVGIVAGILSWLLDMGVRGYILDYIQLPGVVSADLKDILLAVGLASVFADWLEGRGIRPFRFEISAR